MSLFFSVWLTVGAIWAIGVSAGMLAVMVNLIDDEVLAFWLLGGLSLLVTSLAVAVAIAVWSMP